MSWHNGPLMTSPVNVYIIWYGKWPSSSKSWPIISGFLQSLGGSSWYDINTTYYDGSGNHIPNAIGTVGQTYDSGSLGTALNENKILQIVVNALTVETSPTLVPALPADPNGVYFVATSPEVTINDSTGSFCTEYCAWHAHYTVNSGRVSNFRLMFGVVGDAVTQCSDACDVQNPSPNGDPGADAMITEFAHEVSETVVDPWANGWYGASADTDESGDRCNLDFGQTYTTPACGTSACANIHLGSHDYRIQQNWMNLGGGLGQCSMHYFRKNDIFWRNKTNGDVVVQHGDGASKPVFTTAAAQLSLDWLLVGRGDFDGDGNDDFLWRNTKTGDVDAWTMSGPTPLASAVLYPAAPAAWVTAGVGDFDGDGHADILWRNTQTGDLVMWFMNGLTATSAVTVMAGESLDWQTAGIGDFDGDGKADILWRNVKTGDVSIWLQNGAQSKSYGTVASAVNLAWLTVAVADFDGDGRSDVLLQNSITKDVSMWLMNGLTIETAANPKTAWTGYELIGVGDFDGNSKADIMWRNTTTEDLLTWRMNGTTIASSVTPLKASNASLITNGTFSDQN